MAPAHVGGVISEPWRTTWRLRRDIVMPERLRGLAGKTGDHAPCSGNKKMAAHGRHFS
jgi:hypothetical protein